MNKDKTNAIKQFVSLYNKTINAILSIITQDGCYMLSYSCKYNNISVYINDILVTGSMQIQTQNSILSGSIILYLKKNDVIKVLGDNNVPLTYGNYNSHNNNIWFIIRV